METDGVRARAIAPHCDNEAQAEVSPINPCLELLGYEVQNHRYVRVEVKDDNQEGREGGLHRHA